MKTLVVFYSFTGHTKAIATKKARKLGADLLEIRELKKRSRPGAYLFGSLAARKRREVALDAFPTDWSSYDRILIAVPVWWGYPAPAFNTLVKCLPKGKEVEVDMVSASGETTPSAAGTKQLIADLGCHLIRYLDVKAG